MSKILELDKNTLINLDNYKSFKAINGTNGGKQMIVMTGIDEVGQTLAYDSPEEMRLVFNKIKNSNGKCNKE